MKWIKKSYNIKNKYTNYYIMLNKLLIWIWFLLAAILIIENMVLWQYAILFLDRWANSWTVAFVSTLIWIWMWYWIRWIIFDRKNIVEDSDNF